MFLAMPWVHDRLTARFDAPDTADKILVTPEMDANINRFPALVWSLVISDRGDITAGNLTLNLLCKAEEAEALIQAVADEIESWETPGPALSVDLQTFTQNPASAVSEEIKQYVFVYSLTWDN